MYFDILNEVLMCDDLSLVCIGCEAHCSALTSMCIHFYISTRLHFLKKSVNRNQDSREKNHKLKKISKLTWQLNSKTAIHCNFAIRCHIYRYNYLSLISNCREFYYLPEHKLCRLIIPEYKLNMQVVCCSTWSLNRHWT